MCCLNIILGSLFSCPQWARVFPSTCSEKQLCLQAGLRRWTKSTRWRRLQNPEPYVSAYWAELRAWACICTLPDLYNSHPGTWEVSQSRSPFNLFYLRGLRSRGVGGCLGIEGTMEVWGGWVAASVLLVTELVTITWARRWQVQHRAPELSELKSISLRLLLYCFSSICRRHGRSLNECSVNVYHGALGHPAPCKLIRNNGD